MPKGLLNDIFLSGGVKLAPEQIFAELDGYTMEFFEDEPEFRDRLDLFIPLPPLDYEGVFVKGLLFTQAADYLCKRFPWVRELFHVGAYSMWCSYPRSREADFYLCCYAHPEREDWFRRSHPDRADKILIPLQDGDFTNEFLIAPRLVEQRDIDILCVSKLEARKNLGTLAEALKIYAGKYGRLRFHLITGQQLDEVTSRPGSEADLELRRIHRELEGSDVSLTVLGQVPYYDLPEYYSRSRVVVLASLIEGKNRSLSEAMCCNTPVVCFEQFNKFARGPSLPFPAEAGSLAAEGPEALADTLHLVISQGGFFPRRAYLSIYGRENFLDRLLEAHPYYEQRIPDYRQDAPSRSLWLQLAIQLLFQVSPHSLLYDDLTRRRAWHQGWGQVAEAMEEFFLRYCYRLS